MQTYCLLLLLLFFLKMVVLQDYSKTNPIKKLKNKRKIHVAACFGARPGKWNKTPNIPSPSLYFPSLFEYSLSLSSEYSPSNSPPLSLLPVISSRSHIVPPSLRNPSPKSQLFDRIPQKFRSFYL